MIEGFFFEAMTGLAQAGGVLYRATLDAHRSRISGVDSLRTLEFWNLDFLLLDLGK